MSEVCTKDNVCKFFNYEVYDLSDTSDIAGGQVRVRPVPRGTCKAACCQQQNEHCFKSQTAAFKTMISNQCMEERNCEDEATCDPFFELAGALLRSGHSLQLDVGRTRGIRMKIENRGTSARRTAARTNGVLPKKRRSTTFTCC